MQKKGDHPELKGKCKNNGVEKKILDPTDLALLKGAIAPCRKPFFMGCRSGLGGSWQGRDPPDGQGNCLGCCVCTTCMKVLGGLFLHI